MIVSHKHQFIFVRTRKTAGTSVELLLRRFVGPSDVVTRDTLEDERYAKHLGLPGPQNAETRLPIHQWREVRHWKLLRHRIWPFDAEFTAHSTANEIRDRYPDEWDNYFKFAFVRNPWDYVTSRTYWQRARKKGQPLATVDQILRDWDPAQNWNTISIDDDVAVDFVGRYETLQADLAQILATIGLPTSFELPRAKSSARPQNARARDLLSPSQARKVEDLCAREIAEFGYEYPR